MPNELNSTSIHTRYAEQLAADLAANRAEQASIAARLEQLQAEEKWLITTLDSMPATTAPASGVNEPVEAVQEAAVPQPRETREAAPVEKTAARRTSVGKAPAKKAPAAKKTAAKTPKAPAGKPTAKKPAARKAATGKAAEKKPTGGLSETQSAPTLGTLLDGLLDGFPGEPLKVSEIHAEFTKAHPGRSTSVQVVRNALEGLVKKDRIEKDTRQGVALYTKPRATDAAGAGAEASAPAGEPAEAVAAEV
ncbi:hypothetical protein [Streptomyces sp. NPDC055632]